MAISEKENQSIYSISNREHIYRQHSIQHDFTLQLHSTAHNKTKQIGVTRISGDVHHHSPLHIHRDYGSMLIATVESRLEEKPITDG